MIQWIAIIVRINANIYFFRSTISNIAIVRKINTNTTKIIPNFCITWMYKLSTYNCSPTGATPFLSNPFPINSIFEFPKSETPYWNRERFPNYNRFPKKRFKKFIKKFFSLYNSVKMTETLADNAKESFIPMCIILLFSSNFGRYWNTNTKQIVNIERPNESLEFVFTNIQIFASTSIETTFQSMDFRFKYIVNDVILDICAAGYNEYKNPRYSRRRLS